MDYQEVVLSLKAICEDGGYDYLKITKLPKKVIEAIYSDVMAGWDIADAYKSESGREL